jgi:hypothetical protein
MAMRLSSQLSSDENNNESKRKGPMWHAHSIKLPHVDKLLFFALIICSVLMSELKPAYSQDAKFNRSYGNGMLKGIKSDIKKPSFSI